MRLAIRRLSAGFTAIVVVLSMAPAAASASGPAPELRPDTQVDGAMQRHLQRIQNATDANGGVRTPGSPGFEAAAGYVRSFLRGFGYRVRENRFTFNYTEILAARLKVLPGGEDQQIQVINYTPSTPVGGIEAPLVVVPADGTTACDAADFAGLPIAGSVALIQRGGCTFTVKQRVAAAAGAAAVIIYNNAPGKVYGSLLGPADGVVPVGAVTQELGQQLVADPPARIRLEVRELIESRETYNLIAETRAGDPADVLMVGAHLDTIPESPGINDDATGVAALLELARLAAHAPLRKRLRFALWSAEEWGQVGSIEYLAGLTPEELASIKGYVDLAKLGSPNYIRGVLDSADVDGSGGPTGAEGSAALQAALVKGFTAQRLTWEPVDLGGLAFSDWVAFYGAGIPVSGLFSGTEELKTPAQQAKFGGTAGEPYDDCHAQPCDRIDNLSTTVLGQNFRAAVVALTVLQTAATAPAKVRAASTAAPGSLS
jgi:Zn-dependent M28 family amino/carboxypeptidase